MDAARRHRRLVVAVNALKAAIAAIFIARPQSIRAWVGQTAGDPGGTVLLRAFGVRDLSLSIGAISARTPAEQKRWLLAGAVCDLLDAGVTFRLARTDRDRLGPLAPLTSAWAAASGLACLVLATTAPRHARTSPGEPDQGSVCHPERERATWDS